MDDKERLLAFEEMKREVERKYAECIDTLTTLGSEGKVKTVKYRETAGMKSVYSMMLTMYRSFGL